MSVIRILLADDDEHWRHQVWLLLQAWPELQLVCEVSDGPEAVQKAEEIQPDLILLDSGLPELNGIEAARRIRRLSPNTRIVFLSGDNSLDVVQVALSTGAQGYVCKARAQQELLPAIDAVLRGQRFVSSMIKGLTGSRVPRVQNRPTVTRFYSIPTIPFFCAASVVL